MFKHLFFLILICTSLNTLAFKNDTSAYQTQRLRINILLAERSARFGQYDESLNARTGIFGFQTKKDIKNSNEILRQIVLNDNNIFKELKILMEYKDLEVRQVKTNMDLTNTRIQNYMLSIKKLQDQTQILKQRSLVLEKGRLFANTVIILLIAFIISLVYFFLKKLKKYEKVVF